MPAAFEGSLLLSDRRQARYLSIVSELLSLIERTRKHTQASDLDKQIEGATDTASASSTTGLSQKFPQSAPCYQRLREALFFRLEAG